MKIAVDVTGSLYTGTGVANYYHHLVPLLRSLESANQFLFFGYSLRRRAELTLADRTFPLPPSLMDIVWNRLHVFPVERLIGDCDLLHSWDYIQPPTRKAKIVTTIHDLTPMLFPKHHLPKTVSVYKAGLKWVEREAEAVIADSLATKADLLKLTKIPEDNIHVIYLAAADAFQEFRLRQANTKDVSIEQVRNKYGIKGDYSLSVGTLEPRKNVERSVQAFKIASADQTLVVAGHSGWGRDIKPAPGVLMIGYVPDADLPPLYAGASCFLYPSLYEGFGLPVLEAMAVGTPVVTSDRGSLKEIAGDAAVTVNPESVEAIAFGINVALKRRDELSQKGIKQAQQFSWELTAAQTLEVYEKIGKE